MNASVIRYLKPDVPVYYHVMKTPLGNLVLSEQSGRLIGTNFGNQPVAGIADAEDILEMTFTRKRTELLKNAEKQLSEYFNGKRQSFDLPLNPMGTDFRRKAWKALQTIPYGRTISYSDQAEKMGGRQYTRAVGQANHHNPIGIIIPCHRVIGKSGKLVGFASGLGNKAWLLDLEARHR